jgi:hypothetical protein
MNQPGAAVHSAGHARPLVFADLKELGLIAIELSTTSRIEEKTPSSAGRKKVGEDLAWRNMLFL